VRQVASLQCVTIIFATYGFFDMSIEEIREMFPPEYMKELLGDLYDE